MKQSIQKLVASQRVTSRRWWLNARDWSVNACGATVAFLITCGTSVWHLVEAIIVSVHEPLSKWLLSMPLQDRPVWCGVIVFVVLGIVGTIVRFSMGQQGNKPKESGES